MHAALSRTVGVPIVWRNSVKKIKFYVEAQIELNLLSYNTYCVVESISPVAAVVRKNHLYFGSALNTFIYLLTTQKHSQNNSIAPGLG